MNARMLLNLIALALLVTGWPAFASIDEADIEVLHTCQLGSMQLSKPVQVDCEGDLSVDENSTIITNGNALAIDVTGRLLLGTGLTITSFTDPYALVDADAGVVFINANNADGKLTINNYGQGAGFGGYVNLVFTATTENYEQTVNTGFSGEVSLVVGSQQLQLSGPEHSILRQ
jgi:hypothetical protein